MPLETIQPIDPEALFTALTTERSQLAVAIEERLAHLVTEPDDEVGLAALSMHRSELEVLDAALSRHEQGLWNVCESCEARIDDERLTVCPTAITCLECGVQDRITI